MQWVTVTQQKQEITKCSTLTFGQCGVWWWWVISLL